MFTAGSAWLKHVDYFNLKRQFVRKGQLKECSCWNERGENGSTAHMSVVKIPAAGKWNVRGRNDVIAFIRDDVIDIRLHAPTPVRACVAWPQA